MSSSALKLLAASGAKGEATYVDDVFSTFVYDGTGDGNPSPAGQDIQNGIKLGNNNAGPSALFTQTSDYLTGTLSGGSNSKTFTFSGWFYKLNDDSNYPFVVRDNSGNTRFAFTLDGGGANTFGINAYNSSGTKILDVNSSGTAITAGTWHHIMISADLANSSNRYMYLDDVAISANWGTYTDDNIEFSHGETFVGTFSATQTTGLQTYISNPYLDYTYRDLSVESNRRLFIASNETPATGQASLNPILYLPFDSASLGSNAGTGGNLSTVGSPYYNANFGPYIGSDGEGGLVWIKARDSGYDNVLFDTERGATKYLFSNSATAEGTGTDTLTAFNSNGFTLGVDSSTWMVNKGNTNTYASWSFRKQPGFFDVVTYTGDGTVRQIPHNLGSTPGMIIVKRTDGSGNWYVQHISTGPTKSLFLDTTSAAATRPEWGNTAPTDSVFTVDGTSVTATNYNGFEYVAYIFANDAQDFGTDSDESIIKCGSYIEQTGDNAVDLGWEPQFLLIKKASSTSNWWMIDTMRGFTADGDDSLLRADTSDAEVSAAGGNWELTPTGFANYASNGDGSTWIYIAIRRPQKPAEEFAATDLFAIDTEGSAGSLPGYRSNFPVDMAIRPETGGGTYITVSRLTQGNRLVTNGTNAEGYSAAAFFDYQNGFSSTAGVATNRLGYMFARAPGFVDVVCYTGTGSARTVTHNLGVAPEMMWIKNRVATTHWPVYFGNSAKSIHLSLDDAETNSGSFWNSTSPTQDLFTVGSSNQVNGSGSAMIAYLFATVAGISKVGSYTGTGNDLNVDCGFSTGARFILIKRKDASGDWYVWDSLRGIVVGNDPYLLLNTTAAQVTNTDYIDPLASGFTVTSSAPAALNASGGTYLFYAIA